MTEHAPTPTAEHLPASGAVEHRPDCTAPAVIEHDTARRRLLACKSCAAYVALARVARWGEGR